jgi:hypothetical protein
MTASATPRFHIDSPTHWRPEAAGLEITGWLYPGPDAQCVDIRARVDRRPTLASMGSTGPTPRRPSAAGCAALRTGFIQRVQVWRGARELALDYHDGTQWREFFRTRSIPPHSPRTAGSRRASCAPAVVYQSLHYLYRTSTTLGWSELCREADVSCRPPHANSDVVVGDTFPRVHREPRLLDQRRLRQVPHHRLDLRHRSRDHASSAPPPACSRRTGSSIPRTGPTSPPTIPTTPRPQVRLLRPRRHPRRHAEPGQPEDFRRDRRRPRPLAFARRMYLDQSRRAPGPIPIYRPALFYKVSRPSCAAPVRPLRLDSWPGSRRDHPPARHLAATLGHGEARPLPAAVIRRRDQDPYTRWCWHNRLTPRLRAVLQADAATP